MIVKKIENSPIQSEDIELYKSFLSKKDGVAFTANDFGIDKRIVSLRIIGEEDLILVNPRIVNTSPSSVIYYEKDSLKKNKVRKTIRYRNVVVDTDNLGLVEFKPSNEKEQWETTDEYFTDGGLFECVMVQRAIDAINGIDKTHPQRVYTQTVRSNKKPGRNERVMIQSPEGEVKFLKYKQAEPLLENGYSLI